jgi:flagellar biosynthesis protein FlhF
MEAKDLIFRGRTVSEARARMHQALGNDPDRIELVRSRQIREGGFLGIGGTTLWELVARSVPPRVADQSAKRGRAPRRPRQFLARAYGRGAGFGLSAAEERIPAAAAAGSTEVAALRSEIVSMRSQVTELCRRFSARGRPDVCPELLDVYVRLVENEVAEGLAKSLVERVQRDLAGVAASGRRRVREHLMKLISEVICTSGPIRLRRGRATTVALIGPTGVGKTTTVAKLAARFALLEGRRVALVTTDTYRLAAVDQLYRYGELMRLPVREVSSPGKVRAVLDELGEMDLVLLDTAGRSQHDDLKMNDLRLFLEAARPDETHLVLSSTSSNRNLFSAVEKFARFDLDRVLFTKLDEAASCGLLLSVLLRLNKSLSYVTTGQSVPDDIEVGDPLKLARMIVGETAGDEAPAGRMEGVA